MPSRESKNFSADPNFDFSGLDVKHTCLLITCIDLCVHFEPQGICDERGDLSVLDIPRLRNQQELPRANHFSLWFTLDGGGAIMLDVTQLGYPFDPYVGEIHGNATRALVRLSSQKIPTDEDIGCVLREPNVRSGTTIVHIAQLIREHQRQRFLFSQRYKQKTGCRHWISVIAKDLEHAGFTSKGFSDDVLTDLQKYYSRYPLLGQNGRWGYGGNWTHRPEFKCAAMQKGYFIVPMKMTQKTSDSDWGNGMRLML
ncbi:hypothetical protein Hypma_010941 [Hypsizygus marmoreus]|uniref:DUF7770 domain-containing protein n=1 Tax=Hypsizygus marmoreus TaxID=39966 RepID=A0A369JHX0_HYPMA|nr:hypothetical protein Hypma_010941 [Hypsizygus marmoreus]